MPPDNAYELVWWLFNALWLILAGIIAWIVSRIEKKIDAISRAVDSERAWGRWAVNIILSMRTRCGMIHPSVPLPEMPPPPNTDKGEG